MSQRIPPFGLAQNSFVFQKQTFFFSEMQNDSIEWVNLLKSMELKDLVFTANVNEVQSMMSSRNSIVDALVAKFKIYEAVFLSMKELRTACQKRGIMETSALTDKERAEILVKSHIYCNQNLLFVPLAGNADHCFFHNYRHSAWLDSEQALSEIKAGPDADCLLTVLITAEKGAAKAPKNAIHEIIASFEKHFDITGNEKEFVQSSVIQTFLADKDITMSKFAFELKKAMQAKGLPYLKKPYKINRKTYNCYFGIKAKAAADLLSSSDGAKSSAVAPISLPTKKFNFQAAEALAAPKSLLVDAPTAMPKAAVEARPEPDKDTAKYKKVNIPKKVKTDVWNTYIGPQIPAHKCLVCLRVLIQNTDFQTGHVISEFNGGGQNIDNLRPICTPCNTAMGTMNMDEFVKRYGYWF